jgi:hypothetical protein
MIDDAVVAGGATTSRVIVGREPAKRECPLFGAKRTFNERRNERFVAR